MSIIGRQEIWYQYTMHAVTNSKIKHDNLQQVQNATARVFIITRKYDNFSPVLSTLHCIKYGVHFKILLFTYKDCDQKISFLFIAQTLEETLFGRQTCFCQFKDPSL